MGKKPVCVQSGSHHKIKKSCRLKVLFCNIPVNEVKPIVTLIRPLRIYCRLWKIIVLLHHDSSLQHLQLEHDVRAIVGANGYPLTYLAIRLNQHVHLVEPSIPASSSAHSFKISDATGTEILFVIFKLQTKIPNLLESVSVPKRGSKVVPPAMACTAPFSLRRAL
ncbi:hypothetical protein FF38_08432 [Lucilia cuprina]|uniref:Uncharacterized protein n=1 Tax=Lucilia cuprina TaxID=7375 RepID=A0A0L0CGV2_LUCCU|nr:hypothetical protein FF38_08432 [Lucilia cuprina]